MKYINGLKTGIFLGMTLSVILAQSAESLTDLGIQKLESGDVLQAQSLFQQAIETDPSFAPALFNMGMAYITRGELDSASTFFLNAIEAEPDNQEYREEYERYSEISTLMDDGQRSIRSGLHDDAIKTFQDVLDKFPIYANAVYYRGLAQMRAEDYDSAVESFKQTLEIYHGHVNAQAAITNVAKSVFNEANQTYRRGDLEGAMDLYRRVLEIDNSFYLAWYQLGVIEAKMRNMDVAMDHYAKALEVNPGFYQGWFALGLVKFRQSDLEGALLDFQKCIDINPLYVKAYGSMGDIYIKQKNYNEALTILHQAVGVDASYGKGYESMGIIYSEQGEFEKAVEVLEKASQLESGNSMVWYRLAHAYNEIGDCENAARVARKSTDLKGTFGGAWVELGQAQYCNGQGRKTAALNSLEKARNDRDWRQVAEYEIDKIKNPAKYME